jgi:hypothetical protein
MNSEDRRDIMIKVMRLTGSIKEGRDERSVPIMAVN